MRRRVFLAGLVLLAAAPRDAEAQQVGKVFRIGATVATDAFYDAFLQGLGERRVGSRGRTSWSSAALLAASGSGSPPWSRSLSR